MNTVKTGIKAALPALPEGKCACKGSFLDKFVQPAILLYLYQSQSNGFGILKYINGRGVACDPAGFYRTLKKMEEAGKISSCREEGSGEKPGRIYSITAEGRQCLRTWHGTLLSYRQEINVLLADIKKVLD